MLQLDVAAGDPEMQLVPERAALRKPSGVLEEEALGEKYWSAYAATSRSMSDWSAEAGLQR